MPVGFENSALKMSFSLSSLQPSSGSLESPEHARLRAERPYNSLTKKPRKDPEQETWRRSWGNRDDNKDEFWAALQSNYNYLMDNNLIESCKEASGELSWDEGDVSTNSYTWSFNEFLNQFSELYSWLNSIQEAVYGKEENVTDRNLRVSHMEEMQRKAYRRKLFNDQANKLLRRYPDVRDEVMWRMAHLNSKWEMLEQVITPCKSNPDQLDMCTDVEHEVRCLRKWIREMEARLEPLDFRVGVGWSLQELEEKAREHMVVQRDVESHGKIVCSVVKLCEKIARADPTTLGLKGHYDTAHACRVARSLERRWHHLYLRSLEWQCHLESLASKLRNNSPTALLVSDSDEEPVSKVPRLSGGGGGGCDSYSDRLTDDGSYFEDDLEELCVMDTSPPSAESSSVPTAGDTEEEEAAAECYSEDSNSVTMVGPLNDLKKPRHHHHRTIDTPNSEMKLSGEETEVRRSKTGTDVNDNHYNIQREPVSCRRRTASASAATISLGIRYSQEDASRFNESNRKAPNLATFYFKHHDTDSDQEISREQLDASEQGRFACSQNSEAKSVEDSSDDEWTYKQGTASPVRVNGKSDGSGSSSETASSVRRHSSSKKNSVAVRLDFGNEPANAVNNNNDIVSNGRKISVSGSVKIEDGQKKGSDGGTKGSPKRQHGRNSLEAIHRLVTQAEEMVREDASPDKMAAVARAARVFEPLVFGDAAKLSSNSQAKHARIKQWLKLHLQEQADAKSLQQPADSCDASGEYTTGDSDDDKESQSSEELNGSVTTCRQLELLMGGLGSSAEAIPDPETTPVAERSLPLSPEHIGSGSGSKVVLRTKRRQATGERPWSVSGISQLGGSTPKAGREPLAHFSISESALHQMITTTPPTGKSGSGANLSSSTIDEATLLAAEGSGSRNGSLRRRKVRLRKRTLGRKSESGSDGVTVGHSGGSDTQHHSRSSPLKLTPKSPNSSGAEGSAVRSPGKSYHSSGTEGSPLGASRTLSKSQNSSGTDVSPRGSISRTLFKSGSFSGTPMSGRKIPERHTTSDPAMLAYSLTGNVTSGTETEDERQLPKQKTVPMFKLGPVAGAVTIGVGASARRDGDSDMEKNSAFAAEEHLSSFSEQAWDNYQEKYMSEPYSEEPADPEAARRLLEFGDDYRDYINSQSDCASSLSANQVTSPVRRRRTTAVPGDSSVLDSDSDLEDIRHVIDQSRSQLSFSEHVFNKQLAKASPELLLASDFAEIVATCRENIRCLRVILDNVEEEGGLLSSQECKEIRGLVQKWDMLQARAEDLQRVRALQREMAALRDELLDLASRVTSMESELQDRDQLENRIHQVKMELAALRDRKTQLLQVNVAVHRFLTDSGHPAAVLKDEVADLYRVWDETFQSVSLQLGNLQRVSQAWQQFESHLLELQDALRSDQNTLRMLDSALQGGAVSPDVATSVRDVAKVLSEKQDSDSDDILLYKSPLVLGDASTTTLVSTTTTPQSTEGSLSDSGISDSGSEQELSERERRLAVLRRLARHLENALAPGSEALVNMAKRIEQTESELRGLQRACRDLIVRTAVCVEARSALPPSVAGSGAGLHRPLATNSRKKKLQNQTVDGRRPLLGVSGAGDPDDDPEPGKSRPWLWRVMRAALPFQMAIVALFCVACLLEPHCCDAINNLNLSLTPQLRYVRGPPPV
ncbi:klarsicht protein isoform X3 [Periplaneta americana]